MAKKKTVYHCTECGAEYPKWQGFCSQCGVWNSIEEEEIIIENTETRSQTDNRENAMRLLRSQLYDKELERRRRAQAEVEAGKKKIEWGAQIRSYVFDDRRVKDHRTGYQTSNVGAVMDGEIDEFIKAYLMGSAEAEDPS